MAHGDDVCPPLPWMQDEKVIEAPVDCNRLTRRYTNRAVDYIKPEARGSDFPLAGRGYTTAEAGSRPPQGPALTANDTTPLRKIHTRLPEGHDLSNLFVSAR